MLIHKLKPPRCPLSAHRCLATGAGCLTVEPIATTPGGRASRRRRAASGPDGAGERPNREPAATAARMTVTGRVLGPDGQPAAGACRSTSSGRPARRPRVPTWSGRLTSCSARARPTATAASASRRPAPRRPASSRSTPWPAAPGPAPRFGCVKLHPDAEQPAAEIHLQPEQVIRGKLVDVNGQPAAGVEVQLDSVVQRVPPARRRAVRQPPGPVRGYVWSVAPAGLRAWPKAVTTDAQGRFTFAGIGRGLMSPWPSATRASPSSDSSSAPGIATPRRRSRWRSSRPRSSRAASWPPTPASRSPTP